MLKYTYIHIYIHTYIHTYISCNAHTFLSYGGWNAYTYIKHKDDRPSSHGRNRTYIYTAQNGQTHAIRTGFI
jgi:hypothetical protein